MATNRRTRPPLSDGQLEIMQIVWDGGGVTVAEVWNRMSARRRIARNTVQTMMVRLEAKGWLRHRRAGNTFVYTAAAGRAATLRRMVASLVDAAFDGSAEDLVLALLDGRGVSDEEVSRIRKMIDEAKGSRL